jgi:hypothetical protein
MENLPNSDTPIQAAPILTTGHKTWDAGAVEILKWQNPLLTSSNRIRLQFRFEYEGVLSYIAIGWRLPSGFIHAKQKHVPHHKLFAYDLKPDDLSVLMESSWQVPKEQPNSIEIWIKFKEKTKGELVLLSADVVDELPTKNCLFEFDSELDKFVSDVLVSGALKHFNHSVELADQMLNDQVLYLAPDESVDLTPTGDFVQSYEALSNTHRYMYHSLGHVRIFLAAYDRTGCNEYLTMARLWTERWYRANYFDQPADLKYAYYDHGVAERSMVLLRLLSLLTKARSSYGERVVIAEIAYSHTRLLTSWAFVSRHQPFYLHNHAIFQAIAGLLGALVFSHLDESAEWLTYSANLLHDQATGLLTSEGISVENSSGYHIGLQRILTNVIAALRPHILKLPEQVSEVLKLTEGMEGFSSRLAYSIDHRSAFGDTKYTKNRPLKYPPEPRRAKLSDPARLVLYQEAGYASLIDTLEDGREMTLTAIASNLTHTHKHDDDLSFSIGTSDGIEWIADPGFHLYDDSQLSNFAKSVEAHNAPILHGLEYKRSLGVVSISKTNCSEAQLGFSATHPHYERATITREWSWAVDAKVLLIRDTIQAHGQTFVRQPLSLTYTLGDGVVPAAQRDGSWALSYPSVNMSGPTIWMSGSNLSADKDGRLFPPNDVLDTQRLSMAQEISSDTVELVTLIYWDKKSDPRELLATMMPEAISER